MSGGMLSALLDTLRPGVFRERKFLPGKDSSSMPRQRDSKAPGRRQFLQSLSAGTAGLMLPTRGLSANADQAEGRGKENPPFDAAVEPKRPLSAEQNLKVSEQAESVTVSGETFAYTFSKANGLITGVRVLGEELLVGVPVPNLELAEQLDRNFSPYSASRETRARLTIRTSEPARVVIQAEGGYVSEAGARFPLDYSITYDIAIDGVVIVDVNNTARGERWFRWLRLYGGAIQSSLASFISYMPEQFGSEGSHYQFRPLATSDEKILSGVFIPWFWLGDKRVGMEVSTWKVDTQTWNSVDGSMRRDQNEMFSIERRGDRIEWVNYLVRNTAILTHPGWTRGGRFALAVTPSKKFDPRYAMLKGAILGPYQHRPHWTPPSEEQIATLAKNGYNLVVGVANWLSGDYIPLNEDDLRRTIDACHKHGIKVIPYITLMDLCHASKTFRDHAEQWAIEPTVEHFRATQEFVQKGIEAENAYRMHPDQETTLMCPGAPGWRAYWKQQIGRVVDQYEFDGLYFDFWYGKMVCENWRHGCGGRFRTYTVLGAREMMAYAYNRLRAKNPHAIIKANTNLLSTALLTSFIDLRLVGESRDITVLDPDSRRWLYSSYRLGEPTDILWAKTPWNDVRKASFAALINFLPQYYHRAQFSPRKGFDDFDVFRYFGAETGTWHLGMQGQSVLPVRPGEIVANVVEKPGETLATLINTRETRVAAEAPLKADTMAYDPMGGELFHGENGRLRIEIDGWAHRHLLFVKKPEHPQVLFGLGVHRVELEKWDARSRRLRFSVIAPEGAPLQVTLYSIVPVRKITSRNGQSVAFKRLSQAGLARLDVVHQPGERFTARF
jgi:Domain of unknown function (DUF6259)